MAIKNKINFINNAIIERGWKVSGFVAMSDTLKTPKEVEPYSPT